MQLKSSTANTYVDPEAFISVVTTTVLGISCVSGTCSFSAFPAMSLGLTIFGEIFAYVTFLFSNHRGNHIPSSWMFLIPLLEE